MRLYLACVNAEEVDIAAEAIRGTSASIGILVSYWFFKSIDLRAVCSESFGSATPPVFIDSGAFSAKTAGADIQIDEYAQYIREFADIATIYSNLDVIGDAEGTAQNQATLEAKGLSPAPVFHFGEPWEALDELRGYEYIAFGGVALERRRSKVAAWCRRAFARLQPGVKVHGFGVTRLSLMQRFPWYSVDSSSWSSAPRYARLALFDERARRFEGIPLAKVRQMRSHRRGLAKYGLEANDVCFEENFDRRTAQLAGAVSYVKAAEWVNGKKR